MLFGLGKSSRRTRINNQLQRATQKHKGTAKKGSTRVFRKQGVGTYHKPFNITRQQLVYPKYHTAKEKKCGVVYKIHCKDYEEDYIGEKARPFEIRLKQHDNIRRASTTAVGQHLRDTNYTLDFSSHLIIAREDEALKRRIRKAIEMHSQTPKMERDNRYELPVI